MFYVEVKEKNGDAFSNELIFINGTEHRTNGSGIAQSSNPAGDYTISILGRYTKQHTVAEGATLTILI